jgi:hypothetical protein
MLRPLDSLVSPEPMTSPTEPRNRLPFSVWLMGGILVFAGASWLLEYLRSGKVTVHMASRVGPAHTGVLAWLTIALPLVCGFLILLYASRLWWSSRKDRRQ